MLTRSYGEFDAWLADFASAACPARRATAATIKLVLFRAD